MCDRLVLTFMIVAGLQLLVGCTPSGIKITPVPRDRSLKETELQRDDGWVTDKIAVIDVHGVLMNSAQAGLLSKGEHPVSLLVEKLEAARKDKRVKAAVLRINSPGGSVLASEIMYDEVRRFRNSGKPVVAMFMDVAASGGYYIACGCDEIMAYRNGVTGSIGVVMQLVNVEGALAKLGMTADAVKSGPKKDAGSPLRAMQPDERAIFQGMIDEMYEEFVDVVDRGRPQLSREQVLALADGRVYTARQAHEAGLIDRIGTLREALDRAKVLGGVQRCRVVTYQRPVSWNPNIYAQASAAGTATPSINLINIDLPSWLRPGNTRFMYLWAPE